MINNGLSTAGWALLRCAGVGNTKFLQGHLTCDVAELAKRDSILGAACDLKGRVIASMVLFGGSSASADATEPDTLLLLPESAAAPLLDLWRKYLMLYRGVTITAVEAFGAQLNEADELRLAVAGAGTAAANERDSAVPGSLTSFFVDKGIPMVTAATSGLMIPQALNYEELGAISFTKGCYLGQEVVARVHYKGKSSRSCQQVSFAAAGENTARAVRPGTPIHAIVHNKQSEVGLLINCYIREQDNTWCGIALLNKNPVDREHLFINGQAVKLM